MSSSNSQAVDRMERGGGAPTTGPHNPYTYISSQQRFRDTTDEAAQESVDLLQMVPEARATRVTDTSVAGTMHRPGTQTLPGAKVHCTNSPRRMRMVLLPSDTEGEEDSTNPLFHTCGHSCSRDSSIYYSRVNSAAPLGTTTPNTASCLQDNQTNERDDGSTYFDYLQFNKRAVSHAYGSHPSLYTHHKHVNCAEASKEYFKCCKKNTNTLRSNSTSKLYSQFSKSFKRKHGTETRTETELDTAFSIANQNKLKKHREWTRIKRLMFLVGILIGIVVALGGLVIGFLVITPKETGE
jgi:hypothetical protein